MIQIEAQITPEWVYIFKKTIKKILQDFFFKTNLYLFLAVSRQAEEGTEGRDGTYEMREIATHLIGELVGELVGENIDEVVEKAVGGILGVEVEEETDPLLGVGGSIGKALGRTLG